MKPEYREPAPGRQRAAAKRLQGDKGQPRTGSRATQPSPGAAKAVQDDSGWIRTG